MQVEFRRTADRAYSITVSRETGPSLIMDPAPGFDRDMPHDLLHLLVEMELGLTRGIFGQLAMGGTAGTFRQAAAASADQRDAARSRRRINRKGEKLSKEGRDEADLSERISYICLHAWYSRPEDPVLRQQARAMVRNLPLESSGNRGVDGEVLTETALNRVLERMNEWSARWRCISVGECLVIPWNPQSLRSRARE